MEKFFFVQIMLWLGENAVEKKVFIRLFQTMA